MALARRARVVAFFLTLPSMLHPLMNLPRIISNFSKCCHCVVVHKISQLFLTQKTAIVFIEFFFIQDLDGDRFDGGSRRFCLHITKPHRED